ncbi:MAG: DUF4065 domain-containing protein [Candidatus Aegiribacteria sp.]|nr:DUF4065 domain-containing protein [Candidatus Aegiribacteria sp.]
MFYEDDFDSNSITEIEYDLIQEVFEVFGQFSAWKLRCMTHSEPPWSNHSSNAEVIPLEEIKEYFKTRLA